MGGGQWRGDACAVELVRAFASQVCIDGKNTCPPEDCGGPPGYAHFLRAVADPSHPEHDETLEWVGRPWDATAFSVDNTNQDITRLR